MTLSLNISWFGVCSLSVTSTCIWIAWLIVLSQRLLRRCSLLLLNEKLITRNSLVQEVLRQFWVLVHLTWVCIETRLIVTSQRLSANINVTLSSLWRNNVIRWGHIACLVWLTRVQRSLLNDLGLDRSIVIRTLKVQHVISLNFVWDNRR